MYWAYNGFNGVENSDRHDKEQYQRDGLLTPVIVNIVTQAFPKSGKDHYARSVFYLVIVMYFLVDVV
jgi:hypothetical protein